MISCDKSVIDFSESSPFVFSTSSVRPETEITHVTTKKQLPNLQNYSSFLPISMSISSTVLLLRELADLADFEESSGGGGDTESSFGKVSVGGSDFARLEVASSTLVDFFTDSRNSSHLLTNETYLLKLDESTLTGRFSISSNTLGRFGFKTTNDF